jgi:GNAT superfamily N-acetyltransferase
MSNLDNRSEISIRLFRAVDREEVLRIGPDTAFFGAPIEKYMEDCQIFSDGFYSYYTDVEPGFCWVADAGGQAAGFLTGCPDSSAKAGRYISRILPGMLKSLVRGKYHFGPLTRDYFRRLAGAGFRGEAPQVSFKDYPAHLHINVDVDFRSHGLGRRLMNAYLDQLRGLGEFPAPQFLKIVFSILRSYSKYGRVQIGAKRKKGDFFNNQSKFIL